MAESFFATLECEHIDQHRFRNLTEARVEIVSFIQGLPWQSATVPGDHGEVVTGEIRRQLHRTPRPASIVQLSYGPGSATRP